MARLDTLALIAQGKQWRTIESRHRLSEDRRCHPGEKNFRFIEMEKHNE